MSYCIRADIGEATCATRCSHCIAMAARPHWARRPAVGATLLHLVADDTEEYACCGAQGFGPEPWQPDSGGLPKCETCRELVA
mgnify:CR=1 FL=1